MAPTLLTIPLELRLRIYEFALNKWGSSHPQFYVNMAAVCHQMHLEVLPVVLHQDRYLRNLDRWHEWTSTGPPHLLKEVADVTIHLFGDDLAKFSENLENAPSDRRRVQPYNAGWWEAEYLESRPPPLEGSVQELAEVTQYSLAIPPQVPQKSAISKTWEAFHSLSELKKLWILLKNSHDSTRSTDYTTEQTLILSMIGMACPHLRELTVFSNLLPLTYLNGLENLRQLRFSGFSKSNPEETLMILQQLEYLDSIIIFRYPEHYDKDNSIDTFTLGDYNSLTPEVVSQLNALHVFEIQHMSSFEPSLHLTTTMITALKAHERALRRLRIHSDYVVDEKLLDALLIFIRGLSLSKLSLQLKVPVSYEKLVLDDYFPRGLGDRKWAVTKPPQYEALNGGEVRFLNLSMSGQRMA